MVGGVRGPLIFARVTIAHTDESASGCVVRRMDGVVALGASCSLFLFASREQAAANVSIVRGTLTAERAKAMSSRGRDVDPSGGQDYSAAALSLVFHSKSPMVPTFRADVRYFQVTIRSSPRSPACATCAWCACDSSLALRVPCSRISLPRSLRISSGEQGLPHESQAGTLPLRYPPPAMAGAAYW
jgi:hypothetical protein